MKKAVILLMVVALALGGCTGMSTTSQRVLSGGAIGASSGALIGWAAGSPAAGAAIGGAPRASWAATFMTSIRKPGATKG